MTTGGQTNAVPEPGESTGGESTPAPDWDEVRTPQEICRAYGSDFVPPAPLDKVAVALGTLDQAPLNARRVLPERGACGWYIWGGEGGGRARTPAFFQTLPVAHLLERCPEIIPFLALAPGWRLRFTDAGPEITPPHAPPPPNNIAVRRIGSRIARPQSVKHWVWLSILLHILAVALFGDTTGAGSSRGGKSGGPLNVMLQKKTDGADAAPTLRTDTRLRSLEQREGVALLGTPSAAGAPPPAAREEQPAAPVLPPVIATEVVKPVTDFVVPLETPAVPELPAAPAPRLLEPLPKLDAIAAPKALDAPNSERDIALPAELIPRLVPLAPARPERAITVPLDPAPRAKAFVAPRTEIPVTATPIAPAEIIVPPLAIPRITPLAAPQVERDAVMRPAEMLPRLPPVVPPSALETTTPTAELPRLPSAPPTAGEQAPEFASPPVRPPATAAPSAPSATTAPPPLSPPSLPAASRVAPGAPAGDALPADTLTPRAAIPPPPGAAPGSTPRIDLDAVRQRAREIDREGSGPRTLLPLNVRPKPDTRTDEQKAFDKALKRADCRDAYSAMGLAAVVPLLLDSVSEKGCKW